MVTIPGASQFLNAATLANQQGTPAQTTNIFSGQDSTTSLLAVGRAIAPDDGIGISAAARALNEQLLNNGESINELFSLGAGSDATLEGAQQQILALRASTPESQLSREVLGESADVAEDDGGVSESETGQEVDTEA